MASVKSSLLYNSKPSHSMILYHTRWVWLTIKTPNQQWTNNLIPYLPGSTVLYPTPYKSMALPGSLPYYPPHHTNLLLFLALLYCTPHHTNLWLIPALLYCTPHYANLWLFLALPYSLPHTMQSYLALLNSLTVKKGGSFNPFWLPQFHTFFHMIGQFH